MAESNLVKDTLTHKIIGCCYEVHKELGPGFLEKIYARALILQFSKENLKFEYEKEFTVLFQGQSVGKFRCDFFSRK
ncbi:GxxExxY protein [Pedobacter glucosidilyticus]|uniref:GxxExxY protein n=1 Tax=Pedobacter glucosidilyticus TaxID=1122941 RepID=UPI000684CA22|nr:GxxExxY protein [Pedobacter glucosidilyticus]